MGWEYYLAELPLVVGMQLRNVALAKVPKLDLVPPGRSASAKLREVVGDRIEDWL
jgi:hypothetical protein